MGLFNRTKKPSSSAKAPEDKAAKSAEAAASAKADKPASSKAERKAEKPAPRETGDAFKVLLRPLVTEKSTGMNARGGYAFEVAAAANKIAIKKAIKDLYGVDAVAVRVLRVLGKTVRTRSGYSRRATWRKAYVTLKPGQTLDVFAA